MRIRSTRHEMVEEPNISPCGGVVEDHDGVLALPQIVTAVASLAFCECERGGIPCAINVHTLVEEPVESFLGVHKVSS